MQYNIYKVAERGDKLGDIEERASTINNKIQNTCKLRRTH